MTTRSFRIGVSRVIGAIVVPVALAVACGGPAHQQTTSSGETDLSTPSTTPAEGGSASSLPALPAGVTPILSLPGIGDFGWKCGGSGPHLDYTMLYADTTATQQVTVKNTNGTVHRDEFQPGQTLRVSGPIPGLVTWQIRQSTEAHDLRVFLRTTFSGSGGVCDEPRLLMRRFSTR